MTKILHLSNTDIDSDSRIRKEIAALGSIRGAEISVIGVPDNVARNSGQIEGANYVTLRLRSRGLRLFPRAIRYMFELIEFTVKAASLGLRIHADIVHCHDTFALPAGWILKRFQSTRLVYDAHELESNKNGQNFMLSKATLLIERFCWPKIDLLVSVSNSITNWYIQNLGSKPSVLILNAPLIGKYPASSSTIEGGARYFHDRYSIPHDHLVFVYLGIIGNGRGINTCLEAFANGPADAHVVFIGFGPLEELVTDYASRHPNIHFHPAVQHDQVVSLVENADYGLCLIENVSLSDYYCLPNKLFEYCFARLPVLASGFPEIVEIVNKYSLGICCDPKPENVRKALEYIVATRPTFPEKDISDLSWDTQADRLKDVYERQLFDIPIAS